MASLTLCIQAYVSIHNERIIARREYKLTIDLADQSGTWKWFFLPRQSKHSGATRPNSIIDITSEAEVVRALSFYATFNETNARPRQRALCKRR